MQNDDDYDFETPIEETPGYVGHIFDDYIDFSDSLKPLIGFDFRLYGQMADELGAMDRCLEIDFGGGPASIGFSAYSIHEVVSAIPSVDAIYDCPPNQGPAGGSGHIFLLQDGATLEEALVCAQILRAALDKDFQSLEIGCRQL